VLPGGLNWPLDLTVDDDGTLYIADGTNLYTLLPGGALRSVGGLFSAGFPGFIRGVTAVGPGEFIVTTSVGTVSRYRPANNESEVLAHGFDQLYGLAVVPGGPVVAAELGAGRVLSIQSGQVEVLATGLRDPVGVVIAPDGARLVSEAGAGRVVKLTGSGVETFVDGLQKPQGMLVRDGQLYIVDAGAKTLIAFDLKTKARHIIANDLPVGAPAGVTPKPLRGLPPFSGPQGPFAGITAGPDGTLYIAADGDGSVLALRHDGAHGKA
jgi:glucose/arabinose dehydrogenase